MRWALVLAMALSVLALAAVREGRAATPAAQASATKTVAIRGFAFRPPTIRVRKGGRVAFVNSSKTAHTATRAGSFDTRRIGPGESETVRFERRGTFAYHCKIHPFMKGRVVVE
ncbi:MAG TPA: plastocyanin/azurin family copper-binding protein [Solirubrobacterales bacterium]|nr:plastocyanin/azurin family copper-binding protein [Solirubrobacterales bacterium]